MQREGQFVFFVFINSRMIEKVKSKNFNGPPPFLNKNYYRRKSKLGKEEMRRMRINYNGMALQVIMASKEL